jgi:hypothetical protein
MIKKIKVTLNENYEDVGTSTLARSNPVQDKSNSRDLGTSCVEKRLNTDRKRYGDTEELKTYAQELDRLFSKYSTFLNSGKQRESHLILGKVQSGKTAHMIYSIAWAADRKIDAVVVFTGGTDSLNQQTLYRMRSEIGQDSEDYCVHVIEIPTSADKGKILFEEAQDLDKMPLLVSMKNKQRSKVVKEILEELPEDSRVLVIDDEADYISQDGNSFYIDKKESTVIHSQLAEIYESPPLKTLWVSYTATPQAVLLTNRFGKLRPEYCTVIYPRQGYFGLEDLISKNFCSPVTSWSNTSEIDETDIESDDELRIALWDGIISSTILNKFPEVFYGGESFKENRSTQVLLHTSPKQDEHRKYKRGVKLILEDIAKNLEEGKEYRKRVETYLREMVKRNPHSGNLIAVDSISVEDLVNALQDTKIIVFNSDKENSDEERPVSDADYQKHQLWIVIGGDIVGRGVTLPTLTVSYHLRDTKKPNFDTVMQQLRVCGYRKQYEHMVRFYTTSEVEAMLEDMLFTDLVLWNQVESWDRTNFNLIQTEGLVFFASSSDARYQPTSKNKQDSNTVAYSASEMKETMFSLKHIYGVDELHKNLELINSIVSDMTPVDSSATGKRWYIVESDSSVYNNIVSNWKSSSTIDKKQLRLLQALFGMPHYVDDRKLRHIEDQPIHLLVSENAILLYNAILNEGLRGFLREENTAYNSPRGIVSHLRFGRNGSAFTDYPSSPPPFAENIREIILASKGEAVFASPYSSLRLVTPHIGTPQRNLIHDTTLGLPDDSLYFIVEPLIGTQPKGQGQSAAELAVGLAFSGMYKRTSSNRLDIKVVVHD